jgi:hypothetical protein
MNHEKQSIARQAIICQEHRIEAGLASIKCFSIVINKVNTFYNLIDLCMPFYEG